MKNILGGKMLSTLKSFGLTGIDGFTVDVEIDIVGGLPRIDIVGLGDTAVKESKERVKSAIRNSGLEFLPKSITLNLAPADIKKDRYMTWLLRLEYFRRPSKSPQRTIRTT